VEASTSVVVASRTSLSITLCIWAVLVSLGATGKPARTPAEVEIRRVEIASRLVAIAAEETAIEAWLTEVPQRLAEAAPEAAAQIERQRLAIVARRGALAEERARLEREDASLARIPTRTATGPLLPVDPQGLSPLDLTGQSGQVTSGQAFNPAISVIPDIDYYADNREGGALTLFEDADGFAGRGHTQAHEHETHQHGALERGFTLREVELAFSGAVDPYFDVWATFAIAGDGIEAEEVYVQTRRFLPGLQMRVGRFLSGVGHINRQHPHQWDFVDQALPHAVLFGGHLADTGVQVTWLPDMPVYTLVGFEALQGDNAGVARQQSDAYPGVFDEKPGPRLFTGFLKLSPDVGYSNAVQGGVSFGRSRSHQEAAIDVEGLLAEALDGPAWFMGTDWIWRYDSPRPFGRSDITVQGEYYYRRKDLAAAFDTNAVSAPGRISSQDGLYAQAVYGVAPRWTVGGRFDVVGLTNSVQDVAGVAQYRSARRYTAALTFNPTEFSRIRVQYNTGAAWTGERTSFHQLFVQYQMSLGAHGAHRF
jgi:hypothetical protein